MESGAPTQYVRIPPLQATGWGRIPPQIPIGLVSEKNRDRTIIVDTRHISDLRAVNLGFSETDFLPIRAPPSLDIVAGTQRRRTRFRDVAATRCKLDIGGSFNLVLIRPDLSRLMMAELVGALLGLGDNFVASHLLLPFGWVDCRAYCRLIGVSIQSLHEPYGAQDRRFPRWRPILLVYFA